MLRVADTGCGIPCGDLERMFSDGYTTKRGHRGAGLHTSANYLAQMGGTISAERLTNGTAITMVLARERDANEAARDPDPLLTSGAA